MRDSEAVVTPFMQVATYATRNFAHTIPIFRSGMDFLFIQFAHMPYNHYVVHYMHKTKIVHWIPNVKSLRIPKILVSCGLSNLLHLLYTSIKVPAYIPKSLVSCGLSNLLHFYCIQSSYNAHLCIFRAYIPKILVSCGLSNLLYFTVYKYQGSRIYPKDLGLHCAIIFTVSRALRSFPHIVGLHSFLTKKGGSIVLP